LTLCAVFGCLVLLFQDGHLERLLGFTSPRAIDSTQPILIAALAFGLSTDYGVFLLTRIKEAFDGGADNETAVAMGLERTGRMVLLKGYDGRGLVFYTGYESRKGRELAENPHAALLLYWPEAGRQVRVEGRVERTTEEESRAYFSSRPLGSRLGVWASRQSE